MLLVVLGMVLDSRFYVIGLQRPELIRYSARRTHLKSASSDGRTATGGGGAVYCGSKMLPMQARAGRLCLRGGADDVLRDNQDPIARGAKRPRRPDGTADAYDVESLHSAMARADASKYLNPKVRPLHPAPSKDVHGDVVMRGVEIGAGGMGGRVSVANGGGDVGGGGGEGRERERPSARDLGTRERVRGEVDGEGAREREGAGEERTANRGGAGEGDAFTEYPAGGGAGGVAKADSPWLKKLRDVSQEMVVAQKNLKENQGNTTTDASSVEAAAAADQYQKCNKEATVLVDHFKQRMLDLLNWRNMSRLENSGQRDVNSSAPLIIAPEHARGGFACVILDREYGVAYRLEPMQNAVDAVLFVFTCLQTCHTCSFVTYNICHTPGSVM